MDVTRPKLLWVSNHCYRTKTDHLKSENNDKKDFQSSYVEEDLFEDDDEYDETDITINNGVYKISCHIPSIFFSQIIGSKGLTKKRIEAESKAQIQVPKIGQNGDIVITGRTKAAIVSARTKVNLIVLAARHKHEATHFIGIPFNCIAIQNKYQIFQEEVLKIYPNIDKSLFIQSNKLHLTIGMLILMDNTDRVTASETLNECKSSIVNPILDRLNKKVLTVHACGLKIMNDDPHMVHVLYADVKCDDLQKMANEIREKFINKGLAKKQHTDVKLHITLMKSKKNINNKRYDFDASKILESYSNYDFGWQEINEIHLCQRHTTSYNGYYEVSGELRF